jgi:hypothetical protein
VETRESIADNFNNKKITWEAKNAEPSWVLSRQDDDGYARDLYALQDEQLAQEKDKAMYQDLDKMQFM